VATALCRRVRSASHEVRTLYPECFAADEQDLLERFKQYYGRCFAAARAAGLRHQFGQCVFRSGHPGNRFHGIFPYPAKPHLNHRRFLKPQINQPASATSRISHQK
jgi:hypothetical protein